MRGAQKALKENEETDLPPFEEAEVEEDGNANKAYNCNIDAMTNLTMMFNTELDMTRIMHAQLEEWCSGLACKVVKEMFKNINLTITWQDQRCE